jgi:hypothetical protein
MSEVTNTDVVKLIFSSSPPLVSITVVILAHLLSEYARVHDLGEVERRPYFISAILMTLVSLVGCVETILALTYLVGNSPPDAMMNQFHVIIALFITLIIGIISGAVFLLIRVLRYV